MFTERRWDQRSCTQKRKEGTDMMQKYVHRKAVLTLSSQTFRAVASAQRLCWIACDAGRQSQ